MYVEKITCVKSLTTGACERAEQSRNGAEQAENRESWSGAVSGHSREPVSGSEAWTGRPQSGSVRESGCHNNRLKR